MDKVGGVAVPMEIDGQQFLFYKRRVCVQMKE